jgi:toxin YoeB
MKHKLLWHEYAWEDYLYWLQENKKITQKINELIQAIDRSPFEGIGKPEPLRHSLKGYWSRRITLEHRLVYTIQEKTIIIIACRLHYE